MRKSTVNTKTKNSWQVLNHLRNHVDSASMCPMFSDFSHLMSLFSSGIEKAVNGESFPVAMSLKVLETLLISFTKYSCG